MTCYGLVVDLLRETGVMDMGLKGACVYRMLRQNVIIEKFTFIF